MRNWNSRNRGRGPSACWFSAYLWGIETILPGESRYFLGHVFSLPMRNWNIDPCIISSNSDPFSAYLWGIETQQINLLHEQGHNVFSLPMRNWNTSQYFSASANFLVFSLPMRNWNFGCLLLFLVAPDVFSLPMRNWNLTKRYLSGRPCRFQPTYEELKLLLQVFVIRGIKFSAYLWGIETQAGSR